MCPHRFFLPRFLPVACLLLVSSLFGGALGDRLVNLSTRARVGDGSQSLVVGFVIAGTVPKPVLVRAVGPGLTDFGVRDVVADPRLQVFGSDGKIVAENNDWSSADASTFSDVGAFALKAGSRDAALSVTLPPGLYSAQFSGGRGVGIVEVYDVSGPAKLMNVSTRGLAGAGDDTMIAGMSNAGPGNRRVLVRAVGPGLVQFGLGGVLADPSFSVRDNAGVEIASNDEWDADGGDAMAAAFHQAGAFALDAHSHDAALVLDLPPGNFSVLVQGKAGASGIALVELYDLNPLSGTGVSVSASPTATAPGSTPAQFVFSRSGKIDGPLTVNYAVSGSAKAGTDFAALSGSISFAAGESQAIVPVSGLSQSGGGAVTVRVDLQPVEGCDILGGTASVTLYRDPGTVYIADLRPPTPAGSSGAFGSSVVQLTTDERYLWVDLTFSGLASAQTNAYLRMTGTDGRVYDLKRLPVGQVSGFSWPISGSGVASEADIVAGLKAGRVFVAIETATVPSGELSGKFAAATGSITFTAPAAPPALGSAAPTDMQASRFLTQSTFGARQTDIDDVKTRGFTAWLDTQFTAAASSHRTATNDDFAANPPSMTAKTPGGSNRQAAWWKLSLKGDDQLRQRVAFALSELFVVSDTNGTLSGNQEALAAYYDLLAENAFGDFRVLLEKVTLSPVMGVYLSSLRNAKANPSKGTLPDENFAREVMQLFTIGLWQMQPDGTLKLGTDGRPVATYTQATIGEMARVFTGWAFQSAAANPSFRGAPSDYFSPMMLYPSFHDDGAKTVVAGVSIPAGQGGAADLRDTLDALVLHPNTGPFVAKHLIQRLVTSNPSPGYVYRVAQAFANNGAGKRGDLRAVVRAVLMDYEARADAATASISDGKLKEPLLRVTGLLRALEATQASNRFAYNNPEGSLGQAALRAPTVFNFFEPAYQPAGVLADAGLRAPEFQILTSNTAITVANTLYNYIYNTPGGVSLTWTPLADLAGTPASLVDRVNLLLCAGNLSSADRDRLATALANVPKTVTATERAKLIVYLATTTSAGAVQH